MELHVFTNPQQGSTHEQLVATARAAEHLGLDGFFRADHYRALGDIPGSSGDAWITLAVLAASTDRIRLGTLVTSATFRHPGPLAITVAHVDEISGGRVEFGFGTGYFEEEHRAYGIPYPGAAERFARFEEQLAVVTGLWSTPEGRTFSHHGPFYTLTDSPALPKPVHRPPIIIGGRGPRKTPRLVAQYADEFNLAFPSLEEIPAAQARVDAACESAGRAPSTLRRSAIALLVCGRTPGEVLLRTQADTTYEPEALKHGLVGSAAQVVDRIGRYADLGVTRLYLQTPQQFDLDHWEFFAGEVVPQLR
ncbi:LLM class F420-dependent oxidoreductase [Amycolatopsis sp. NPDC051903]|uniref:LLM class F420-dependent oxidoreductase n=1 Tax=Amycolatopsis sp. NPDC051903 TaxID=3363936 RepID=UPI0037B63EF4